MDQKLFGQRETHGRAERDSSSELSGTSPARQDLKISTRRVDQSEKDDEEETIQKETRDKIQALLAERSPKLLACQ